MIATSPRLARHSDRRSPRHHRRMPPPSPASTHHSLADPRPYAPIASRTTARTGGFESPVPPRHATAHATSHEAGGKARTVLRERLLFGQAVMALTVTRTRRLVEKQSHHSGRFRPTFWAHAGSRNPTFAIPRWTLLGESRRSDRRDRRRTAPAALEVDCEDGKAVAGPDRLSRRQGDTRVASWRVAELDDAVESIAQRPGGRWLHALRVVRDAQAERVEWDGSVHVDRYPELVVVGPSRAADVQACRDALLADGCARP